MAPPVRFAYWSPASDSSPHVGAFTRSILSQLVSFADVVHVATGTLQTEVGDCIVGNCVAATAYQRLAGDIPIYEIDDAAAFHPVYAEAIRNPGIVILRDAYIPQLSAEVCGGDDTEMFAEEVNYSSLLPAQDANTDALATSDQPMLSRRIVESNIAIIVASEDIRASLSQLVPTAQLRVATFPDTHGAEAPPTGTDLISVLIGIAGGIRRGSTYQPLRMMPEPIATNAIGSWTATTGLAEAGRRTVTSLLDAHVRVALEHCDLGAPTQADRFPSRFRELPKGRPYAIDLCFMNINELELLTDEYLRPWRKDNYLIGSWYWELPALPEGLVRHAQRVDEIWVASNFVKDTLAGYTSAPITVFPSAIAPVADETLTRAHFGLPEERCIYIFNFDAQSTFARKNPWAIIEAFRRAFPEQPSTHSPLLVLKAINLDQTPEGRNELVHALRRVGGVLIEENLAQQEMAALISLADVYVSLHRSEGFGMGMAEAMYFGKPVIATAYSGNADFTHVQNSCPVGYQMVKVTAGDLRFNPFFERVYEPGQLWAAPYIHQAASWMQHLFKYPAERKRIGAAGQKWVQERFSSEVIGAAMRDRLTEIRTIMAS